MSFNIKLVRDCVEGKQPQLRGYPSLYNKQA